MRADADHDTELRLYRTVPVGRIRRLLHLLGIWIGEQRGHLAALHQVEDLLGAVEHEDGTLPQRITTCWPSGILLISRSTGPPAASVGGVGIHLVDERHQGRRRADRPDSAVAM